jgi:hypothetical protein
MLMDPYIFHWVQVEEHFCLLCWISGENLSYHCTSPWPPQPRWSTCFACLAKFKDHHINDLLARDRFSPNPELLFCSARASEPHMLRHSSVSELKSPSFIDLFCGLEVHCWGVLSWWWALWTGRICTDTITSLLQWINHFNQNSTMWW